MENFLTQLSSKDPDFKATLEVIERRPWTETSLDDPIVKASVKPYRTVIAINPCPTNTEMLGKFIPDHEGELEQQKQEVFISSIPLGKLIEPEDIAQSALYLCSPLSEKVTGTILNVDGGRGI